MTGVEVGPGYKRNLLCSRSELKYGPFRRHDELRKGVEAKLCMTVRPSVLWLLLVVILKMTVAVNLQLILFNIFLSSYLSFLLPSV